MVASKVLASRRRARRGPSRARPRPGPSPAVRRERRAVDMPAASSIQRMLRRVASASSSASRRLGGQCPQQRQHAGAVRLERVDPPHQQIEQPVAHRPLGRRLRQRRLVGQPAEAQQDRGTAGEALASARQRQAGGARGRGHAERGASLAPPRPGRRRRSGPDRTAASSIGASWRQAAGLTTHAMRAADALVSSCHWFTRSPTRTDSARYVPHDSLGRRKVERLVGSGYAKNQLGPEEGQRDRVAAGHPLTVVRDHALQSERETDAGRGQQEHGIDDGGDGEGTWRPPVVPRCIGCRHRAAPGGARRRRRYAPPHGAAGEAMATPCGSNHHPIAL